MPPVGVAAQPLEKIIPEKYIRKLLASPPPRESRQRRNDAELGLELEEQP